MVKFYFSKFRILLSFIIFLIASLLSLVGVISLIHVDSIGFAFELLVFILCIMSLIITWKQLNGVYNKIPALIIDHDSIYIFQINKTLLWKDIESYELEKYWGHTKSINFKLENPKAFISSIENTSFRLAYQLRYFLFRNITIKISKHLLEDYPELIIKNIDAVINKS